MPNARLALAILFALPLALHAQTSLLAANDLPDAPLPTISTSADSAVPQPDPDPQQHGPGFKTYTPSTVIVNGRAYHFPTPREQFREYEHELIGLHPILRAAIRGGIEQIKPTPAGWGQDFPGYMQRFGDAYGEAAISNTVRYGMGTLLHEDNRYLICHHCSVGAKFANAALAEFTARHGDDGHRTFSPTPIAASLSGPLIGYAAWYPPDDNSSKLGLRHVVFNVSTRVIFNCVREFLFDRDTPQEKAAKQAASSTTP